MDAFPIYDEAVDAANSAVERHADNILSLALSLVRDEHETTLDAALTRAKNVWLSLLADPEIAAVAGQPAHETAAARLLRQHLEGRPS